MLTYLKCAWVNPFTRFSYLIVFLGLLILIVFGWPGLIFIALGLWLLWMLNFGAPTYVAYRMTSKRLRRENGITPFFLYAMTASGPCIMEGFTLAVSEQLARIKKSEARR